MLTTNIRNAVQPQVADTYPVLKQGRHSGMIVLFTAPKTGMIVAGNDPDRGHQVPGYFSAKWAKEDQNFVTLPAGTVVELSNG